MHFFERGYELQLISEKKHKINR